MPNIRASSFGIGVMQEEHPNKMPFSGVLTWLNVPSDNPPQGSAGRLVVIPASAGESALESLVGMAVNYIPDTMDGHAPQEKIGIITGYKLGDAQEDGAIAVYVEGFIYNFDFPEAASTIKSSQDLLGFSYETARTLLVDGLWDGQPVAVVQELGYFTGASILYKNKAAYTNTSIAANSDEKTKEGVNMEEFMEKVLAAIAELKATTEAKNELTKNVAAGVNAEETGEGVEVNEVTIEKNKDEPVVTETGTSANIEPQVTGLSATADLQARLDTAEIELAELRAYKATQEAARKSIAHPTTLMAKYQLSTEDNYENLMASIDARTDLNVEERLALKMEARLRKAKDHTA